MVLTFYLLWIIGFALDDYMVNFFQEELYELGLGEYQLLERVSLNDISFGMVGFNSAQSELFMHFFQSNDDNRNLMAALGMKDHQVGVHFVFILLGRSRI